MPAALCTEQHYPKFYMQNGLLCYDGYHFITYRHDSQNPHSLSHNSAATVPG